jgi:hypothetical protein
MPSASQESASRVRDMGVMEGRYAPGTADEWAEFLQRVYRLDTGPWLQRLIGRTGWHQYVVRESGEIVGARCMYVDSGGMAWHWAWTAQCPA